MGSCDNSLGVQESLHWAATEQHSCLIKISDSQQLPCLGGGSNTTDIDVGPTCALDQCLDFCQNGNSGCVNSGDLQEPLSIESGTGSACESRNAVDLVAGKLLDDEFRVIGGYLEERQSGIVDCNSEIDGLCVKKLEPSDENDGLVNALEDCVESLDIGIAMPVSGTLRNYNQQDEQNEDRSGDVQGDMEDKSDAVAATDSNRCDQMMPLLDSETPVETDGLRVKKLEPSDENDGLVNSLEDCVQSPDIGIVMPVSGSLRNRNQQDEQNEDRSGDVQGDMEEKSDALAATDSNTCDQMMPSSDCEKPAELKLTNALSSNEVDQDNQDGSASLERVMVVLEDRKVGLPGAETDDHNPMQPLLDPKTLSELIPTLDSSSNCVQQCDQKDDQIINSSSAKEITEVIEKESKFLQVTGAATCGQLLCDPGFDKSLELMPVFGFLEKNVKQDEQKDDRPVNLSCENGVETVAKNKIFSSSNDESCVRSDSFSDFSKDCCQRSDLEAKTVSSVASGTAVDEKIDALAAMESDLCTQKPLHSIEMLKKISITGFTVSSCEKQDCGKNGKDVNYLAALRAPTDILKKSDVDNYLEACSSQTCQKTFESLPMDNSLGNFSQENEQRDGKSISDPFEESAPEVVEEESDITAEIKVEVYDQKFYMEADAYDLKEDSPEIAPNTPQSCQPFNVTENGASRGLDASDPFGKAVFGAMSISTAAESYEEKDNEGEDLARNDCPPKTGCPNISSSSSRRSSRICKSCHKTQTKKAARKHKNKAKLQDIKIFKADRRKRTCLSKPARSSNWGSLGNIAQFFEQSNGLELKEIVPSKTKVGRERRKQNKSRVTGSSQQSSGKEHAPMTGIRLKVKLGNKVCRDNLNIMVSEVLDTPAFCSVSDFKTKSYTGTSFEIPSFANGMEDKMGEDVTEDQLQCLENKLEEAKIDSDASILDLHVADKDLEGTVISQKSTGEAAGGCHGLPSHVEVEELGAKTEKRYTDPGTSPDSEVINLVPENHTNTRCQEDFPDAILTPLEVFVAPEVVSSSKKGKKGIVSHVSGCFPEDISRQVACANKVKTRKKQGRKESKGEGFFSSETLTSSTSANASSNSSSNKESSEEVLHLSSKNELLVPGEALQAEIKAENKVCSSLDAGLKLSETQYSNHLLPSTKSKGSRLRKKSGRASKGRSKVSDKARSKRENGCRRRGNEQKSNDKDKVKEKSNCGDVNCKAEDDPETVAAGNCILDDTGKTNHGDNIASIDAPNIASSKIVEQHIPVDNAWVRCDDCHKWRRIHVALVDSIGQTNCQWICRDNMDKAFADCSTPQEKSNAEINAELGLSDADEDAYDVHSKSKGLECRRTVSKEHEFMRISANQFLHRSRKTQTIDEIMVCNCKLPLDGSLGCGDECLNRMLNIECVQGTCPCGDCCSNQQFQKHIYAKMKWDRCGKKGFGLRLEEDISKGQFLIEYVGEVLDMHTYEARQSEYAFKGHKHFYFMTLNGSEVIDACAKGNMGRFINHSCDPNCRTEKWVVNGEICIGLFALRDIKKGEEVTFDYNYVRVVGAAAKKCYCGSSHCRGYIGGDPTSTEVIDQVDSDEEFLEPVMLEDGEAGLSFKNGISRTSSFYDVEQQIAGSVSKDKNNMAHSKAADVKLEFALEIEDSSNQSVSTISQLHSSLELDDFKGSPPSACQPLEISENSDDISSKSVAKHKISIEDVQRSETSPTTKLSKLSSDGSVTKLKSKSSIVEEKRVFVKSRFLIKTSRESSCTKKGKLTNDSVTVNRVPMLPNKSQVLSIKPKKLMNGTSNGRFEAVEEKLNELLDVDGGISKRKEAAKCYLKFLLLTAASGASGNGEAIQSNRDLSMILDALLKTKSRAVLIDIINKNGLRMLHNMMKQYRRDFKKTPILRKLLKVLEYLAFREILTQEHITGGPPCPGMESFTDSILSLTEHDDKQVHHIARNFRDKWIPRHCRRFSNMDRNDGRMDFHKGSISNRVLVSHNHLRDLPVRPIEAIDCAMQPKPATASVDTAVNEGSSSACVSGGTKSRKRKSRWDQPAKEKSSSSSPRHDEQKIQSVLLQQSEYNPPPVTGKEVSDHEEKGTRQSYCPHCARNYCRQDETSFADNGRLNNQSDVPPGFSSPINPTLVSSSQQSGLMFPVGMAVGYPPKKFISHLSVSYGIPMPIVQQFGPPQDGTTESWAVAPGLPFHPFPPLPPFPHYNKESRFSPAVSSAVNSMVIDETAEEGQPLRNDPAACDPNENNPSTTGSNQPAIDIPGENGQQSLKRARASHDLGRRYFRQQKWNKVPPPWVRNRDGWGYLGNNSRGGICNNDVGSVTYEHRNSYCSQDLSCRVDKAGNKSAK